MSVNPTEITPEERGPTLHEDDLNPLKDNNNGMGAVGMAMGAFFGLEMMGDMTEALGAGLDSGAFTEVGAMPQGGAFDAALLDLQAMQPTPAPQVAPAVNPNANNPFMIKSDMSGPGGMA